MSKSIGAGLPISAVTGRAEIMDAPNVGEIGGTYGGSPLGCVAALEVIKTIQEDDLLERANLIGKVFKERFERLQVEQIGEVRQLGAMCAIEFVKDRAGREPNKELVQRVVQNCHQNGLVVMTAGLYGNIIRLLVPLVVTDSQLNEGIAVLEKAIKTCTQTQKA